MSNDRTDLETIRSRTLGQLVDLRANPKPTYSVDGQQVKWETYAQSLQDTVDWCDRKLAELDPFEIESQGTT